MAGNYYNGYTKSLPRVAKKYHFQLVILNHAAVGGTRRGVELFYTREELDTYMTGIDRCNAEKIGSIEVVSLERWSRGKWVTL